MKFIGYTNESLADITSVVAGTGLSGGGTTGDVTLNVGQLNQDTTGTATNAELAAQATILATARAINGVDFNGSAPITVTAAAGTLSGDELKSTVTGSSLTSVGTIGTGVWQGTTIKTAYIGNDQVTEDKLADTLLAEIDANTAKNTNVVGDLTASASGTALTVATSNGENVDLPAATNSRWGIMSDDLVTALEANTAKNTNVVTNLSVASSTGSRIIASSDGTNATIPVATTSASGVMSPSAVNAVIANNAKNTSSNVYGDYIRLLPSDFATNSDGGNTKQGVAYVNTAGTSYGMKVPSADTELFAFVSIPEGMKATDVEIFGKRTRGIEVFEVQINATTMTSKGTGNCNTELSITNVDATATNLLAIYVDIASVSADRVYGGRVKIAAQ